MVPDPPEPGYKSLANAWLAIIFLELLLAKVQQRKNKAELHRFSLL